MRVVTDFHLHSRFSRACSPELTIANIAKACARKGINFVGTSDFTHPRWREEIGEQLKEVEMGTYQLKDNSSSVRFLLSSEISCIYKRNGKVRRVHHLVLCSSLAAVDQFCDLLNQRGCNLKSDGRPMIGLDSEELYKILLEADPTALLIPAHAWTPWFAVFGSMSGFDSLQDCFGEMTKYIYAIETGLSSDPSMNRRLSQLDSIFCVSNSDAHSLDKLGREANVFEMTSPSFSALRNILVDHDTERFLETIEFFPEEGKYHHDGHRLCRFSCTPEESRRLDDICPICQKRLTIGVLNRVDLLADRKKPNMIGQVPYRSIIPLAELVAEVLQVKTNTKKVAQELDRLLADGRNEFSILLDLSLSELARVTSDLMVEAIRRMRAGEIIIKPGFDGEYGVVSVFGKDHSNRHTKQKSLSI